MNEELVGSTDWLKCKKLQLNTVTQGGVDKVGPTTADDVYRWIEELRSG